MKLRLATAAIACSLLATWVLAQEPAAEPTAEATQVAERQTVRHIVLFKFNEDAPAEKVAEIEQAFADLANKIHLVSGLEWGTNNSPEGLTQGFTHCFQVTFDSLEDRDAYLPHPAHKEFVKLLRPYLDEALVIDYTPQGE
jgi:hypothetical protein